MIYTNSLIDNIELYSKQKPHTVALYFTSGGSMTWRELDDESKYFAMGLVSNGFKKGDRIFFFVMNSRESIVSIIGIMRAGGVLITADPGMGGENLKSRVALGKPQWTICSSLLLSAQNSSVIRRVIQKIGVEIPQMLDILDKTKIIRAGAWLPGKKSDFTYKRIYSDGKKIPQDMVMKLSDGDDFQITFTSGTTSAPKGVVHTHGSIIQTMKTVNNFFDLNQDMVFFTNQFYILFPALFAGSTVVYNTDLGTNPKKYFEYFNTYHVTEYFDIPKNLKRIQNYCEQTNQLLPSSLNSVITGSTPIFQSFLEKFRMCLSPTTNMWAVYGMTEMLPVAVVESREKIKYTGDGDLLGKPVGGIKVYFEADGELVVSGGHACDHLLLGDPIDKINTGDICTLDDGRLVLLSRKKDMIIKAHANVYPSLFESTISKIEGVLECSMVGCFNTDRQDEDIILFVVRDSTKRFESYSDLEFKDYIIKQMTEGDQAIDVYAIPDIIYFLKSLPTSGGRMKVDKNKLREMSQEYEKNK